MAVICKKCGLPDDLCACGELEKEEKCIYYDKSENLISITCKYADFEDVTRLITDPSILKPDTTTITSDTNTFENNNDKVWLLYAGLKVEKNAVLDINSNDVTWLKIIPTMKSPNAIEVDGSLKVDSVKITSWNASTNDVIQQDMDGSVSRGYIQFDASEGAQILNSEFGYLGYDEPGRRGFDLYGGGGPSHDMVIRGSTFHDMWFAFYSNAAYNIVVDGSEYHHNIRYALDPHTATYNMNITNNYLHHNRYGAICSQNCYNILIEGNRAHHNTDAGIVFSRNMTNSIARNNHVYNATTGISLSESPNNQIYNNTIESATDEGILLFNPEVVDDGFTEGNMVYDNVISSSEDGIRATNSHDNILENNTFDDIESSK